MGALVYSTGEARVHIPDQTLAHLKAITLMKLRRNESFAVTVRHDGSDTGRTTFWLHPSIALQFTFDDDTPAEMDRALLEELMHEANTGELVIHATSPAHVASLTTVG